MRSVQIGTRGIGLAHKCYVIAEAGVNHNGDLKRAKQLVDVAAAAGADAVKFQLYCAEEQVSRVATTATYQKTNSDQNSMLEMAKSYDMPWECHHEISRQASELGIDYISSCFEPDAVDFLVELGVPCLKISSGEITNERLLVYAANQELPIILSTGMSNFQDVAWAVDCMIKNGNPPVILLHCVSCYPAPTKAINLRAMLAMRNAFHIPVGYSDHTENNLIACAAVAMGASIVEKHFTIDKTLPGPDHAMSLSPDELTGFIKDIRTVESALGNGTKHPMECEQENIQVARRSVVSARKINAGEILENDNVTFKRPATGIDPRHWSLAKGRTVARDVPADTPISWDMLA